MTNKKRPISSGLQSLEDSFSNKTTETITNTPQLKTPNIPVIDNSIEKKEELGSANVEQKNSTQQQPPIDKVYDSFSSFINKNFECENSTQMMVNKDIKRILEKIAIIRKETTQVSLVSNILKAWIEEHRTEIQKLFKENSRIDF
jgi:hypothetical protein